MNTYPHNHPAKSECHQCISWWINITALHFSQLITTTKLITYNYDHVSNVQCRLTSLGGGQPLFWPRWPHPVWVQLTEWPSVTWLEMNVVYIYIYIYVCVCVCVAQGPSVSGTPCCVIKRARLAEDKAPSVDDVIYQSLYIPECHTGGRTWLVMQYW